MARTQTRALPFNRTRTARAQVINMAIEDVKIVDHDLAKARCDAPPSPSTTISAHRPPAPTASHAAGTR